MNRKAIRMKNERERLAPPLSKRNEEEKAREGNAQEERRDQIIFLF